MRSPHLGLRAAASAYFVFAFMISSIDYARAEQTGAEALQAAGGMPVTSKRAINENQVESFSKLQITLDRINDQYEQRLAADVEGDHSQVYAEASEKMAEAIKQHGLTIAEYHRIAGAVIVDEETHRRVVDKLKELRGASQE